MDGILLSWYVLLRTLIVFGRNQEKVIFIYKGWLEYPRRHFWQVWWLYWLQMTCFPLGKWCLKCWTEVKTCETKTILGLANSFNNGTNWMSVSLCIQQLQYIIVILVHKYWKASVLCWHYCRYRLRKTITTCFNNGVDLLINW